MTYSPRIVDGELSRLLSSAGAIVIEGPKACGKTATARQVAASEVLLDLEPQAQLTASVDPSLLLVGPKPLLLDEWQLQPALWNHVRRAVDDSNTPGAFILTGSAAPIDDVTRHTGAGRFSRLRMRPMSLSELGASSGAVSLSALFEGDQARSAQPDLGIADLIDLVCVGGWPGWRTLARSDAMRRARDYVSQIERTDIQSVDGVQRDPLRVGRVITALARSVATYATATTIAADSGGDGSPVDDDTVRDYVGALERLMVVENQPAWAPHLRSRSRVRSASKRHFADPSIAVAALGATPEGLLRDLRLFGFLFESMVIRDLRVYAQAMEARVLQYRDNTGLEVDAVIERADGRWAAVEVKLGVGQVDEAAATLLRFAARIDVSRSGEPAALVVVTGTGYGYRRPDGVSVVPIGALGP